MKCNNCCNFKPDVNIEAGAELFPNVKALRGKCGINDKSCRAQDECGCGGFAKK